MDFLQRSQLDLSAILKSEADFQFVPVLVSRPRDEGDALMIQDKLNKALMGLEKYIVRAPGLTDEEYAAACEADGKSGLAVLVLMPDVEMPNANSLTMRFEPVFTIRVRELPMINEGADGTGISAEQCALNIIKALHQRSAGGNPFYADKKVIREVSGDTAGITYDVVFRSDASEAKRRFVAVPALSHAAPLVTMTCATSGAAIYYTTDGSFPDKAGTLYAAPVGSLPTGTVIRAAAYKDGLSGSDVAEIEL